MIDRMAKRFHNNNVPYILQLLSGCTEGIDSFLFMCTQQEYIPHPHIHDYAAALDVSEKDTIELLTDMLIKSREPGVDKSELMLIMYEIALTIRHASSVTPEYQEILGKLRLIASMILKVEIAEDSDLILGASSGENMASVARVPRQTNKDEGKSEAEEEGENVAEHEEKIFLPIDITAKVFELVGIYQHTMQDKIDSFANYDAEQAKQAFNEYAQVFFAAELTVQDIIDSLQQSIDNLTTENSVPLLLFLVLHHRYDSIANSSITSGQLRAISALIEKLLTTCKQCLTYQTKYIQHLEDIAATLPQTLSHSPAVKTRFFNNPDCLLWPGEATTRKQEGVKEPIRSSEFLPSGGCNP